MTRPQGILTENQRAFLKSADVNQEYSRQKRYRYRKNIRQRVRNAMKDFHLLARELPDDQLREIFELKTEEQPAREDEEVETWTVVTDENVGAYISQAIAFFARAKDLDDYPIYPQLNKEQPALAEFTRSVEKGVQTHLANQKRISAQVTVSIELENAELVEELVEKAKSGDADLPPTLDLIRVLSGDLSDEERELLQQALKREQEHAEDASSLEADHAPADSDVDEE